MFPDEESTKRDISVIQDLRALMHNVVEETSELEIEAEIFSALVDRIDIGVVVMRPDGKGGHFSVWNRAARVMVGSGPSTNPPDNWIEEYGCRNIDGSEMRVEELPIVRAMHGEEVRGFRMIVSPPGVAPRALVINGFPVRDHSGHIIAAGIWFRTTTL